MPTQHDNTLYISNRETHHELVKATPKQQYQFERHEVRKRIRLGMKPEAAMRGIKYSSQILSTVTP